MKPRFGSISGETIVGPLGKENAVNHLTYFSLASGYSNIWEERSWKGRACILLLIALTGQTISYLFSASLPPLVP